MEELISVIIPAHNAEKYIQKCLESVIKQTYKNIEIIIIIDNSVDNTLDICNEFEKNDRRITVFEENNGSAGKSRNSGLSKAKGKYVLFVDADDYIDLEMCMKLYKNIKNNKTDACFCGYIQILNENEEYIYRDGANCVIYEKDEIMNNIIFNTIFVDNTSKELPLYAVWSGMYDLNIIKNNNIHFLDEGKYYSEDCIFNFEYLSCCKKVSIINDSLYNYNSINEGSICNSYNKRYSYIDNWYDYLIESANEKRINNDKLLESLNNRYLNGIVTSIKQEIVLSNKKFTEKIKSVKIIGNSFILRKILKSNKYYKNKPIKRKVIIYLIKFRMYLLLFLFYRIKNKEKK